MKKHVVIIEDEPELLHLMGIILEKSGYKTTQLSAFFNFAELSSLDADCFVIDERLPYVNGHIICIMLKSNELTSHIPVVLTSGYDNLEGFANLCQADDFLSKPFDAATLSKTVSAAMEQKLTKQSQPVS